MIRAVAARQLLGNGLPRKVAAFFTKDLEYPFDVSYLNALLGLNPPLMSVRGLAPACNATSRGGTIGFLLRACRVTNTTNQSIQRIGKCFPAGSLDHLCCCQSVSQAQRRRKSRLVLFPSPAKMWKAAPFSNLTEK